MRTGPASHRGTRRWRRPARTSVAAGHLPPAGPTAGIPHLASASTRASTRTRPKPTGSERHRLAAGFCALGQSQTSLLGGWWRLPHELYLLATVQGQREDRRPRATVARKRQDARAVVGVVAQTDPGGGAEVRTAPAEGGPLVP